MKQVPIKRQRDERLYLAILLAHVLFGQIDGQPLGVANEAPSGSRKTNYQSDYVVYPHSNRTCLSTGSWSGPPPICAGTLENKNSQEVQVIDYDVKDSSAAATENWVQVGKVRQESSKLASSEIKEKYGYATVFRKHFILKEAVYLASVAIAPPPSDACRFESVLIKVPPQDPLLNTSPDSTELSRNFDDNLHSSQGKLLNLAGSQVVQQLSSFSCQVYVEIKAQVFNPSSGISRQAFDMPAKLRNHLW